ncbi:MAG TPA: tetratricopeptide repeat protein [Candidatus Acidoferrum sp.]|nr:tetratricopeptide repeat protein [Candidatus Acidoferrum sp.]
MADTLKTTSAETWSGAQASALVVVCLLVGIAGGWLVRRSTSAPATAQAVTASAPAVAAAPGQPAPASFGMQSAAPSAQRLKEVADTQAAPLLLRLKAEPANAALLANVGNLYYDAKQYPVAIDYYERSLKIQPADTSVRTDLGTAYWYTGNADTAIVQFNKSLSYDPKKADTLFNLGIVKWQGKKDGPGAVAAWKKLLETNPDYPDKDAVLQLMAQAQQR